MSNIIPFVLPSEVSAPAVTPTFDRKPYDFYTTKEISQRIKAVTGYNSKQCSVKSGSSLRYVTVTVRDPKVDVAVVEEAVKAMHTWVMAPDDCVRGQSITVETTPEVDDIHAEPFILSVTGAEFPENVGGAVEVVPGVYLVNDGHNCFISDLGYNRGQYVFTRDYLIREKWAVRRLAIQVYQTLEKIKRAQVKAA